MQYTEEEMEEERKVAYLCGQHGLALMDSWQMFSRSCWNCGAVQVVFPEYYLCDRCRAKQES